MRWYHAAIGIAALPASVLFGLLLDQIGASVAFAAGSGIAIAATVVLTLGMRPLARRVPSSTP